MRFTGKVALITGAGSGLGEAAAIAFAREGASVVLCGRRKAKIEAVQKQILQQGGIATAIQADVSEEIDVSSLIQHVLNTYGRLDILVNNAAVFEFGQVFDLDTESWDYQLKVNLTGPFLMIRASLPIMRKQAYGRIINITSSLAYNGAGGYAAYSASKAGLESLTRTTADEESTTDILVNLFNPGTVRSEMHSTGREPFTVIPELLDLASLQKHGMNGQLVEA